MKDIESDLFKMQDLGYRDLSAKLIPTADKAYFIGVRTPLLRKYAKQLISEGEADEFLHSLPHRYHDENQLHSMILSLITDYDKSVTETERFLPFVDNWATCDQLSPVSFRKHRTDLLPFIRRWISSDHTYTVRFAVVMLMSLYLDEGFSTEYSDMAARIRSDEYYINMAVAWYFATALAKQYDSILPYLTEHRQDRWVHNKTIQKAVESYRITDEHKSYLRTLRIKSSSSG